MFQGVSLYDHLRKYEAFEREKASRLRAHYGHRKYNLTLRMPPAVHLKKWKDRLTKLDSINVVVPSGCCKHQCLSQFDAPLIYTLRLEMHHLNSKLIDSLRLGVYRHSYSVLGQSSKICYLEGCLVCMQAWRKIYGVSKTDFYRYKQYTAIGRRAQKQMIANCKQFNVARIEGKFHATQNKELEDWGEGGLEDTSNWD
jgi:hypothetical protein